MKALGKTEQTTFQFESRNTVRSEMVNSHMELCTSHVASEMVAPASRDHVLTPCSCAGVARSLILSTPITQAQFVFNTEDAN